MEYPVVATVPGGRGNVMQYANPNMWNRWDNMALQAYWGPGGEGEALDQSGHHGFEDAHTRARLRGQGGVGLTPESSVITESQAPASVAPSRLSSYPSTAATSRPLRAIPEHEQEVEPRGRGTGASHSVASRVAGTTSHLVFAAQYIPLGA